MAEARPLTLRALVKHLDAIAPERLAEPWDNVGLLVGDPDAQVRRALVCIDFSPAVQDERRAVGADVVLAYHPPVFKAEKRALRGSVMFDAAKEGYGVYAPHTALDVAKGGTNDVLARDAGLKKTAPLRPRDDDPSLGLGRIGTRAAVDRRDFLSALKLSLETDALLVAGPRTGKATTIAVSAGAAGDMLFDALRRGADVYVTGELRHHDALAAAKAGMTVVMTRHSVSERRALRPYAEAVKKRAGIEVVVSSADRDPFVVV